MATIMDTLFGVSAERFQQERDAAGHHRNGRSAQRRSAGAGGFRHQHESGGATGHYFG